MDAITASTSAVAARGFDASEPSTDAELVAFARRQRELADDCEARLLLAAGWWAHRHSADSIATAETFAVDGTDTEILLGGEGCPLVAEFAVAEFAAAVGLGPEAGKNLVAEALELRHRLPRLWCRVHHGEVQVWRARLIARDTQTLSREGADHVDRHLAPFAHSSRPGNCAA